MTELTGRLVLAESARLVAREELPEGARRGLEGEAGEVALTDPLSRTPSRLVSADFAALLAGFRAPARVVDVVRRFSVERGAAPEAVLEEVYPLLRRLFDEGFLLAPDRDPAAPVPLRRGDRFAGCLVLEPCQATEDSELVQARGAEGVVALKVERRRGALEPTQSLAFEAAVLAHLGGGVAPRLLAAGVAPPPAGAAAGDGRRWLALEWVAGVDPERAARELRPGRAALHELVRALLAAYAALHEQGVVHGDVHPRNLLVSASGEVRLLDFGVAAWPAAPLELQPPPRGGVAFYYEPECARALLERGSPLPPSPLGEQHAVAALAYRLLAGAAWRELPLAREPMLRAIAEEPPLPFAARGAEPWPEAEALLARALAKWPEERFPTMGALLDAWTALAPAARRSFAAAGAGAGMGTAESPEVETSGDRGSLFERRIEATLSRLAPEGEAFEASEPAAPSASVFLGAAGVAYALTRLAGGRASSSWLSLADHWAAKAAQRSGFPSAWIGERWGMTPEVVRSYSPFQGAAGLAVAEAWLARALGEPELEGEAVARFAARVREGCADPQAQLDLTLGLSGALLACANLLPGAPEGCRGTIAALGEEVYARIWGELDRHPPVGEDPAYRSLGMAHGWAGLLYAALRWRRAAGRPLSEPLAARLHALAELAEPWGRGHRWRHLDADGGDLGAVAGWCNGSAGLVFLWEEALRHHADPVFAALCEGAAWHAWEGPDEGADLCCGVAGRSYALLAEFRRTGDGRWLDRATALAALAARLSLRSDDAPDSLFKGGLGVAVLCADLERPATAAFPFFEEER